MEMKTTIFNVPPHYNSNVYGCVLARIWCYEQGFCFNIL